MGRAWQAHLAQDGPQDSPGNETLAKDAKVSYDTRQENRRKEELAEQQVQDQAAAEGSDQGTALEEYRHRETGEKSSLAAASDARRNQERIQWARSKLRQASFRYIGYDGARRSIAEKLGVDPYSTNLELQERLDAMAWALWAGQFGTNLALPTNSLLGTVTDVDKLVWQSHPKDLEVTSRKALKELGVSRAGANAFFENPFYSTSDRTEMIANLGTLGGVANRAHFFHLAQAAEGALLAAFYRRTAQILVQTHERRPLERVVSPSETLVVALTESGDLLLVLAVDHLAWTRSLDLLSQTVEQGCLEAGFEGKVVLELAGGITTRAQSELEALDWKIETWGLE